MHPLTTLLRPLARGWLQRVQGELSLLPVPTSAPRQRVSGAGPDRVLVFGNGPATGFGVTTQELGIPGQLARALARLTERGVEVDLVRGRGFTIASAVQRLDLVEVQRYDAVVITLGATDAGGLLREDHWERALRALIAAIKDRSKRDISIVVLGIRPQATAHQGVGVLNAWVDRHASRLDAVSARVASSIEGVLHVEIAPALAAIGATRYYTPDSYRAIAETIAGTLTAALTAERGELEPKRDVASTGLAAEPEPPI